MTTALSVIPARPVARKDLSAFLAACSMEQLVFMAYEAPELPEYADCPDWIFEACYDETDRRMFDGPNPLINKIMQMEVQEVAPPAGFQRLILAA